MNDAPGMPRIPQQTGVPILRLGDVLVTGLLNELDDKAALAFTDELTTRIVSDAARGVLIDISRLEIIDSFVARTLMELTTMARLLGARVIVAGMRPAVAITLVELGLQLTGVETALNAEQGLLTLGWQRMPRPAAEAPRDSLR
ncbi:STAS domain-containing protein [Streptomyces sp. NPDC051561]|uniref:STAS domain-containing protein n=1 Tax=Streptomyces sp. NPDC051561 TaxID=3365658 RepID=UPI003788064E